MKTICALVGMVGIASAASASVIPDRSTLNTILGGGGTTDTFESYSIVDGGAEVIGVSSLDETTIAMGQGPGLVNDGCTYNGNLQWNGNNYFALPTRTLLANSETFTFQYDTFTTAMGVDLHAFAGYADTAMVSVYDNAGGLLFSGNMALPNDATGVFFGFESAGGIGSVVFDGAGWSWSPIANDHTYGVPAPASLALLGLGGLCGARRRR